MAVSNYIRGCEYSVNRLDKVVYLFSDSMAKDIRVDNGAAYVTLASSPIAYEVNSIEIEDTSSLDERYEFSHRVSFSVNGYANDDFIGEKYYVAVKTVGGAYYILNPRIPCRVQYTFTLGKDECHTDFVMDTVSNDATLPLNISSLPSPKTCGYYLDGLKSIKMNEAMYSKRDGNVVCYTNDGFKDIDLGMDAVFTESFDGEVMTHNISFTIPMTVYKQSWYYNLLEFNANTYSALIESKSGRVYASGFGYGLQPSYTMNGNSTDSAYISVRLECIYDSQTARYIATSMDDLEIGECEGYSWEFVLGEGTYECVEYGFAKYLLKRQLDELGNPTGLYMCLYGYEDRFADLNIIGTFDEVVIFPSNLCKYPAESGGTLPSSITFNDYTCYTYTFSANCDWNASSEYSGITFIPTSGEANILYDVEICNNNTWTGATQYRWSMSSDIICDGYNAYYAEKYQYSNDGGNIWYDTGIERYGALIEENSSACGYNPNLKWMAYNTKNDLFGAKCDSSSIGYGTSTSGTVKEIRIGDCVEITENFFPYPFNSGDTRSNVRRIVYSNNLRRLGNYSLDVKVNPNYMPIIEFPNTLYVIGNDVFGGDGTPGSYRGFSSDGGKTLEIVIPNSVYAIGDNVFRVETSAGTSVKKITIGDGVGIIGSNAFKIESSEFTFEDIVIGSGITSIEQSAFSDLYPKSVTIHATTPPLLHSGGYNSLIGGGVFSKCFCPFFVPRGSVEAYKNAESWKDFKERIFPIGDDIFTTAKAYSFVGDFSTEYDKKVIVAEEDGTGVLRLSEILKVSDPDPQGIFLNYCSTIYIGDSVKEIINDITPPYGHIDYGNLHHLVFSPNSQLVKIGDYAFGDSSTVAFRGNNMRIYNFPSKVESIGVGAFARCKKLNIDGTVLSDIKYIGDYAFDASNLRDITINNTSDLIIGYNAFGSFDGDIVTPSIMPKVRFTSGVMPRLCGTICPSHAQQTGLSGKLETNNAYLYVPFDSVEKFTASVCRNVLYDAFYKVLPNSYPTSGTYVVEPSTTVIPASSFTSNSGLVGTYVIPKSVETIGSAAFNNCSNLYGIIIESGSNLTEIAGRSVADDTRSPFSDCYKLNALVFPDTVNFTTIPSQLCYHCGGLKYVKLPNNITTIDDDAFNGCGSLTSITIPSGVTSIGNRVFQGCSALTSINIPSGVTNIGGEAFLYCSGLTNITIPSGVDAIAGGMFSYCNSLTSVTFAEGSQLTSIGQYAFMHCENLVSLSFPSTLYLIGGEAFTGCSELSSVTFGDNSQLSFVGYSAFMGTIITEINLGSEIFRIDDAAFSGITSLRKVICMATTPPYLGHNVFDGTPATIYVPDNKVSTYKAANRWSDYANRIVGISNYNNLY